MAWESHCVNRSRLLTVAILAVAAFGAAFVHGQIPIKTRAELGDPFVPRPEVAKL